MRTEFNYPSDVAFTETVKAIQKRKGSRGGYSRMEENDGWETRITPDLRAWLRAQRSVFLATANGAGQPYIQHRGGPAGFLTPLDDKRFGFADFSGNRQYVTQGNLEENAQAFLFTIDYANRRRVKIWGQAQIIEDDPFLLEKLTPEAYPARVEQALVFTVTAWDVNCPQHIPLRFDAEDVQAAIAERDAKIAALEQRIETLSRGASGP